MKVAIVYDRVNKFGGAERVLLALHEIFPKAPLYTSVYSPNGAKWAEVFLEVRTSFLQKIPLAKNNHEFFSFLMPFAFSRFNFDDFDLVISVTSEFAKNIKVKSGKHICYCLTPTRYLWSHKDQYFNFPFSIFIKFSIINWLKKIDLEASEKPDVIIAISTEVQRRIRKYYKRNAEIIFPPVNFLQISKKNRSFGPRKGVGRGYYLIVSRLVKYKRVDLAIEAFNELNLPLVIVGTGREERKLKRISKPNIFFAGFVSEKELANYYKNAKALIFPQEEDFGITVVEAQSFGIPAIAYKKGGSLDTVSKNTGVFFVKQDKEHLVNAIKVFEKRKFSKKVIMKNAGRFSKKRFKREFLALAKSL